MDAGARCVRAHAPARSVLVQRSRRIGALDGVQVLHFGGGTLVATASRAVDARAIRAGARRAVSLLERLSELLVNLGADKAHSAAVV